MKKDISEMTAQEAIDYVCLSCVGIFNSRDENVAQNQINKIRSMLEARFLNEDLKQVGYLMIKKDGTGVAYAPVDWDIPGFDVLGPVYGNISVPKPEVKNG